MIAHFRKATVGWMSAVACSTLVAQEPEPSLGALRLGYEVRMEKLSEPIAKLETAYEKRLAAMQAASQESGDLEAVLAIRKEREGFPEGRHVKASGELAKHQSTFRSELARLQERRDSTSDALTKKYMASLENLRDRLTKAREIEGALEVQKEMARIKGREEAEIEAVKGGSAWRELKLGVDATTNRPGRRWKEIPEELAGMSFSTYAVRAPGSVTVVVKKGGRARVAMTTGDTFLQEKGWEPTDLTLKSSGDSYRVWTKVVSRGELTLAKPGRVHGYVVIRKNTSVATPPDGQD